jgi:hypothetical protein
MQASREPLRHRQRPAIGIKFGSPSGGLIQTDAFALVNWEKRDVLRRATIGGVFDRHDFSCCQLRLRVRSKKYDPGVSDTEIKIGQTMPFSGPASAYATISKAEAAYFR